MSILHLHLLPRAVVLILAAFTSLTASAAAASVGTSSSARVNRGDPGRISLENGLVRRVFVNQPNVATVALDDLRTGAGLLRSVRPEALVTLNGRAYAVGGLGGQRNHAFLLPDWIPQLTNDPAAFQVRAVREVQPKAPVDWKRTRWSSIASWPPKGVGLEFDYGAPDAQAAGVSVTVHYELYDGLPVVGKWLTVSNGSPQAVTVDAFASEVLAAVEGESAVDAREKNLWRKPPIDVLSDYMFNGMDPDTANKAAVWEVDPLYKSQVHYERQTPCLLLCKPPMGPGMRLAPGETLASFRSYLVIQSSTEREDRGLALRQAWRALAPWTAENPIMMHVRRSESEAFRTAVDQCVDAGFELIIYTFGSGINMENESPDYIASVKRDVDYAHSKGLAVGAYSLFSSRRIDDANDVINPKTGKPGGAIFGNAPCFASQWGTNYLRKIKHFLTATGLDMLELDGPYPGDFCASATHPGHRGLEDSQWVQWRMTCDLFSWCRARGIYVNQPDCYFLAGGNKTGMGYREENWSLPRREQLLHARQNIYDGTWTKNQTMGWMFVPLTEYQGGGAAATIEPLRDHLKEYETHFANTLGSGVQACWRGPRLYDSEETRAVVKKWVSWFKRHREVLEGDVIHCRRADGRDLDYLLLVKPGAAECAFSVIHNPTPVALTREIELPLGRAGLKESAWVRIGEGRPERVKIDNQGQARIRVTVTAEGRTWLAAGVSRKALLEKETRP